MFAKFIVVFLALSTFASAAPAIPRDPGVSVHINGHIRLRDPVGPPPVNSHESESKFLASDIATDLQKVHDRAGTTNPPQPNSHSPPSIGGTNNAAKTPPSNPPKAKTPPPNTSQPNRPAAKPNGPRPIPPRS